MTYAAPSLRLFLRPSLSHILVLVLGVSASSLADVSAARGGLDGGEGSPLEGTSGTVEQIRQFMHEKVESKDEDLLPLGPYRADSSVCS